MTATNPERAARAEQAGYRVRPPTVTDAEEIGLVHLTVWQQAYTGVISEKFLRSLTVESSIGLWRDILARPETRPASRLVGVAPDGTIGGMVAWGASRDENPVVGDELLAIDVLSDHHGTGLADLLLMNSIGEGSPQMLWVLTANTRAQAFYRRYGFLDAGSHQHLDEFEADVMLMLRSG